MALFVMGDLHLSLSSDKSMDIFGGWENYVERIKENWNREVSPEDTVVVPGDISWAMSLKEAVADFRYIHELPGRKIILKGNHDYWWTTAAKMNNFLAENGFDSIFILHNNHYAYENYGICGTRGWFFDNTEQHSEKVINREAQRLKTSIEAGKALGGEPIVFLHYPPVSVSQVCEPIYNILLEENIRYCYYAHLHGQAMNFAFTSEKDGIKFELLSADYLKFCPKLIKLIK